MKIVSWNVRGLGNPIKKKVRVKGALRKLKADIVLIQEAR